MSAPHLSPEFLADLLRQERFRRMVERGRRQSATGRWLEFWPGLGFFPPAIRDLFARLLNAINPEPAP